MKRNTVNDATRAKNSRLLIGGLFCFYGIPVVGLIVGYGFGKPDIGFMFGAYLMFAIPAGLLLAIVSGIVFMVQDSRSERKFKGGSSNREDPVQSSGDDGVFSRVFWVAWLVTAILVVGLFALMTR